MILPNLDGQDAAQVAERLRERIAALEIDVAVTVSAGVSTWPANATDPLALVRAADRALYVSKRDGRDRVTVAT